MSTPTIRIKETAEELIVNRWPDDPVAVWGIQAYSFLIPNGTTLTAAQLAALIPLYYDESDPRTAAVIAALNNC